MKLRLITILTSGLALCLLCTGLAFAGENGALTPKTVDNIRSRFIMDPYLRAMYNAVTNNNISKLALNRDLLRDHNNLFSHKIKSRGITDQKASGRCWIFASLNTLRPVMVEKYKLDNFEFSQNYLAFWDKMEKANTFLEFMIEFRDRDPLDREMEGLLRRPIGDGGYWQWAVNLIEKYGVVPKEIMPETNSSENSWNLNYPLERLLHSDAARLRRMAKDGANVSELRTEKEKMLADVYKLLVMNLGMPPVQFEWRYETKDTAQIDSAKQNDTPENDTKDKKTIVSGTYTPLSFYHDVVGVDLDEYVDIFDNPTQEYYRHILAQNTRNMYDRDDLHYVSVPVDNLKKIAMASVLNDEPVVFACDVGHDQDSDDGIMAGNIYDYGTVFDIDLTMSKEDMARYFESTSNHMMVFLGVDTADGQPVKWLVENSWGDKKGKDGYWTLYNDWFDNYVYGIIVKKKYVPEEILKIYDQKPLVIPPWDPNTQMHRLD
nr:C1 family peptidase [candidate division Zixibacteria bacterium]